MRLNPYLAPQYKQNHMNQKTGSLTTHCATGPIKSYPPYKKILSPLRGRRHDDVTIYIDRSQNSLRLFIDYSYGDPTWKQEGG